MNRLNTKFLNYAIIVYIVIAVYFLFSKFGMFDLIQSILFGLIPFYIAFFITWLVRPLGFLLQQKVNLSKHVSNFIAIVFSATVLVAIIFVLIPVVFMQIGVLFEELPQMSEGLTETLKKIYSVNVEHYQDVMDFLLQYIDFSSIVSYIGSIIDLFTLFLSFFGGVIYVTTQFIFGYIIAFLIIDDFGRINKHLISKLFKRKENAFYRANEISNALYGYVKGTAIVCITVFVIISTGTYFIGLSTPLLFGTMAAVFNIIPYVGPYLAAIPIVAVALSMSPTAALLAILLVGGTQFVEAYFLQPKIMGKSTHLHPVTIMVGLLVFHSLFGLVGMIIGTPIVVVVAKIVSFTDLDIDL